MWQVLERQLLLLLLLLVVGAMCHASLLNDHERLVPQGCIAMAPAASALPTTITMACCIAASSTTPAAVACIAEAAAQHACTCGP